MYVLTSILLICAAGLSLAWLVAAQRRFVADAARRFVALPRLQQVLVVFAVCILTVCAQKSGSNVVFNAEIAEDGRRGEERLVGRDVHGTPLAHGSSASPSLLNLRVENSLASSSNPCESVQSVADSQSVQFVKSVAQNLHVTTNEVFDFSPPEGACLATNWLVRGAATDYRRIRIDGEFPFDGVANSNFVVFANGVVYLQQSRKMLKPFSASLGIVPVANWGKIVFNAEILEEGRRGEKIIELSNNRIIESEEASASGSDDSRRTAENAEVETAEPQAEEGSLSNHNSIIRQFDYSIIDSNASASPSLLNLRVNKNISAQIEFFPNGDFITRSNEVEWVYRRINPDDWDDDGIANEKDDEPMVAADETQFDPNQTLPDDANSNAYCWVDVVVPQANATFVFNAEIMEFGRRGA